MVYLLFAGDDYFPAGGMGDFVGVFETLEEAQEEGLLVLKDAHLAPRDRWGVDKWAHIAVFEGGTLKLVSAHDGNGWCKEEEGESDG